MDCVLLSSQTYVSHFETEKERVDLEMTTTVVRETRIQIHYPNNIIVRNFCFG
jgi:hypothetical protein